MSPITVSIRSAFVAPPHHVLLSADYSQLELRVMAHLSGDPLLLKVLGTEGGDVFRMIASEWLGKSMDAVSEIDREKAKQGAYGIFYR